MTRGDLVRAVREFFDVPGQVLDVAESAPMGVSTIQVRRPAGAGAQWWIRVFEDSQTGQVRELRFEAVVGCVYELDAFRGLLRRNWGGVMNSPFFFSCSSRGGYEFLSLEAATAIDAETTVTEALAMLEVWSTHPLLTRTWDFPAGVENFLWES